MTADLLSGATLDEVRLTHIGGEPSGIEVVLANSIGGYQIWARRADRPYHLVLGTVTYRQLWYDLIEIDWPAARASRPDWFEGMP